MAQPRGYPKIIQDITGCIEDLTKEYRGNQVPITDDCLALHKFCAKLEYLLQIDMKARTNMLGTRRDYWDYFYKCLCKVKGLNDGLRFVKAMTEVKSPLGRGRAFIRYSLVHHRLGDSLQQCITSAKITSDWYSSTSVLLNAIHSATIVKAFYDLNDVQFDLAPTGYDLDTAWPSFARRFLGAMSPFLWRPPDRTISTSSINSLQSTSDSSYPNSPMADSRQEEQLVRLQRDFEECEQVNRQLRERIHTLELDSEEIHQTALENEEQLAVVRQDMTKQTSELQDRIQTLLDELASKEEEMECKWKKRVSEAEETASDVCSRIEVLNKQHETRERLSRESEEGLRDSLLTAESTIAELQRRAIGHRCESERVPELGSRCAGPECRGQISVVDFVEDQDESVPSPLEKLQLGEELMQEAELRDSQVAVDQSASDQKNLIGKLIFRNTDPTGMIEDLEALAQMPASEKVLFERRTSESTLLNIQESKTLLSEEKLLRSVALAEHERDNAIANEKKTEEQMFILRQQNSNLSDSVEVLEKELSGVRSNFDFLLKQFDASDSGEVDVSALSEHSKKELEVHQYSSADTKGSNGAAREPLSNFIKLKMDALATQRLSEFESLEAARNEVVELNILNAALLKQLNEMTKTQRDSSGAVLESKSQNQLAKEKARELASYVEQTNALRQRVADLKESSIQKSLDLETHQQNLNRANDEIRSLRASLAHTSSDKQALQATLASLQPELSTLEYSIRRLQAENKDLERIQCELREDCEKGANVNKELNEKLGETANHECHKQELIKEHEDKVEFLTQQFNMMIDQLEKATVVKDDTQRAHGVLLVEFEAAEEKRLLTETERNEIKKTNDDLNAEIARINKVLQESRVETARGGEDLQQLRSEMFEALEGNTTRMLRLENELHDTRLERDAAKTQTGQLQTELAEAKEELAQSLNKCEDLSRQLTNLQCVMEQEVSSLKFQLSSEAMDYQQTIKNYKRQVEEIPDLRGRVNEHEEAIGSLQAELSATREQSEQQQSKVKEFQDAVREKENQRCALQEAILQMSKSMEDLELQNLNYNETLSGLKQTNEGKEISLQGRVLELEDENVELKKEIIKLIRGKDTLWQWTDKLDHQRKLKASERWIEDRKATQCMQCLVEFSLTVRRHHCRLCGRIFCTKCCNCYVATAHSRKKSRVCEECFVVHQNAVEAAQELNTIITTPDSEDGIVVETVERKRRSFYDAATGAAPMMPNLAAELHDGTSSHDDTFDSSSLLSSPSIERNSAVETSPETHRTTTNKTSDLPLGGQPADNAVIILDSPLPLRRSVQSTSGSDEPDFHVIEEEEIVAARNDELSASASPRAETSRPSEKSTFTSGVLSMHDLETGTGANNEIIIRAGHSHAIPIHLDAPGIILCWEFASAPKTIAFSVTYQPASRVKVNPRDSPQQLPPAQLDELIPLCKCNSHRHAVQGELMVRKAGIYMLLFDNTFSRFTQKSVKYSLQVKRPEAAY